MAEVDSVPPSNVSSSLPTSHEDPSGSGDVEISNALTTTNNAQALTTGDDAPKKIRRVIRKKRRPARVQVDPADVKSEPPPQTGTIFNIWYNKWSGGDREDKYLSQTHAKGRCNIAQDSGYTKADQVQGSFFCLMFARGLCSKGHECQYLHRLPGIHDHFNPNVDCFGRDKHSDYRDDMGGVGSFMRQNRTLYVGRIHVTDDIEEIVARHFAEWGDVERTRVLTGRGVAFVTYASETNSQFAKEAMAHQSLDHNEILNVRWATQDPNPLAQKREVRRIEEQAAEAIRRALPAEFVAEIEGRDPETVKKRRIEGSYGSYAHDSKEERRAIESAPQEVQDEEQLPETSVSNAEPEAFVQQQQTPEESGGILSNSTLAALKGYALQGGNNVKSKPKQVLASSLVGYDSDEDSD
jgi:hypothetical protein